MMEKRKECYVWTFNQINSFVFYSKEECLRKHNEYKQFLKETMKTSLTEYKESQNNRECPSFGFFEIFFGRNTLSTVWKKTHIV